MEWMLVKCGGGSGGEGGWLAYSLLEQSCCEAMNEFLLHANSDVL